MNAICLNMIVKNEAPVLRRCLDSVLPWIDRWVVVDTGSGDGTQDLVRTLLRDRPGALYQRPWVDYGHNRSEGIELARSQGDYLLFMDADEILVTPPGWARPTLDADAYQVEYHYGNLVYCRPSLVATRHPWAFEGVLHEYLVRRDRPGFLVERRWQGPHLEVFPDGARRRDPEKFRRDAAVLAAAVRREPHNARHVFYLAQSWRDAGEPERALAAYQMRAAMPGFVEETWHALYQIACMLERLERPEADVVQAYLRAQAFRPQRAEAFAGLARYWRLRGAYAQALACAVAGLCLPMTADQLFVEADAYRWLCLDEFAVSAYWMGRWRESLQACERLLAEGLLPAAERERVQANRAFALRALAGQGGDAGSGRC